MRETGRPDIARMTGILPEKKYYSRWRPEMMF
jgi:hypothetical protein